MQVTSDYSTLNIFQVEETTNSRKKSEFSVNSPFDTVSISDAALEAYSKSKISTSEMDDKSDSDASKDFKKYFNNYRGNGIFAEDNSQDTEKNDGVTDTSENSESEKISKKVSEIERKIKDLMEKLETVMSSDMPEQEKNAMEGQIQKEISELQSQLTAYKQAEKAFAG